MSHTRAAGRIRHVNPVLIPFFLAVLGLNACADGGAIVAGGTPCNVPLTTANGIWIGGGNFVGGGTIVGMISGGNIALLQLTGDNPLSVPNVFRVYTGTYTVAPGGGLVGTADVYEGGGRLLASDQELRIGVASTLNVTIGPATALMPLCPLADGAGRLLYERPTVNQEEVNLLVGNWTFEASTDTGPYTLTYSMFADGGLNGSDTPGCVYDGRWRDTTIPARNLYRIEDMTLTNQVAGACDQVDTNGTVVFAGPGYQGFGFFLDANPESAQLLWTVVANGSAAYFMSFNRVSPPPAPPPIDEDEF